MWKRPRCRGFSHSKPVLSQHRRLISFCRSARFELGPPQAKGLQFSQRHFGAGQGNLPTNPAQRIRQLQLMPPKGATPRPMPRKCKGKTSEAHSFLGRAPTSHPHKWQEIWNKSCKLAWTNKHGQVLQNEVNLTRPAQRCGTRCSHSKEYRPRSVLRHLSLCVLDLTCQQRKEDQTSPQLLLSRQAATRKPGCDIGGDKLHETVGVGCRRMPRLSVHLQIKRRPLSTVRWLPHPKTWDSREHARGHTPLQNTWQTSVYISQKMS